MKKQQSTGTDALNATFRPKDLREQAGMSYRQLHHAETKGAAQADRETRGGWRQYSFQQVFVLLVCKALRERFGIPVDALGWLTKTLLAQGEDHFARVYTAMRERGLAFLLITDLEQELRIQHDVDFADVVDAGDFRNDDSRALIVLKLNPIVNQVLAMTTTPEPVRVSEQTYKQIAKARRVFRAETVGEAQVLGFLRDTRNRTVKVYREGAEIIRAEIERERDASSTPNDLAAMFAERPYQRLEFVLRGGSVRAAQQSFTERLALSDDDCLIAVQVVD
jgi:DNA-binding transcriptional MerR regulator